MGVRLDSFGVTEMEVRVWILDSPGVTVLDQALLYWRTTVVSLGAFD